MNRSILIPRRKSVLILPKRHQDPSWLKHITRHISSWPVRTLQNISNYRHYRKQGICRSIAWAQARNTL